MVKIMIASLPIGTGHDIAAAALAEACLNQGFDVQFSHHLVGPARWETKMYFYTIRWWPQFFAASFRYSNRSSYLWSRHRERWREVGLRFLKDVYVTYRPDVVVATHPFALAAWSAIKEENPQLNLIAVLTDLSVHRLWFEPLSDAYTVWLPEQSQELQGFGVPLDKIWPTGIPIRESFHDPGVYARYRKGPIVLLGGGLGLGPYSRILQDLSRLPYPILAVCGHNEKLRWQLDEHRWPDTVTVLGYVDHMPELLRQSRLVVGKPGGVTAAEVAQIQVPWVLTHWIPGQEEMNRDRLLAHHLAIRGDTNLAHVAAQLMGDDSPERQNIMQHQKRWARPLSAEHIAERIRALVQ